ncbi:hypothetical protein [Desulfuromonas thiophila]|uniref:Ornithine cyclodeaminase/alanine dehydrogenase, mu-crystallin family n=1 Tax=Desulfuromonas thiophila TaxID=57664 RepID=A0A1G7EXC8_9BACT|nr:hypothetical protein [Desulfuromonas thiophila]SDE68045.1 Ornithine cyclodeaminase/alanine dehydrogenase, mu-crystallin family [Desulfuromonas thiophila]
MPETCRTENTGARNVPDDKIVSWLRLADEGWIYLTDSQIHRLLMTQVEPFMERLERFYASWPEEREILLPVKQVFTQPGLRGDFRVMPCVVHSRRLKCVKIIGTNEEQRRIKDKICVGKALLIDYTDNHVFALMDVCVLSSFRTAAIACLALARSGLKPASIGLCGVGRIGFYMAVILHRWLGCRRLVCHDPDCAIRQRFEWLCSEYLPELRVDFLAQAELLTTVEAVFLATTSQTPLCYQENAGHLRFIASVGADADNLSELDESLMRTHRLITDSRQSICLGDMKRWHQAGLLAEDRLTELRDLDANALVDGQSLLFVSTGVALQDALVCEFLYEIGAQHNAPVFAGEGW